MGTSANEMNSVQANQNSEYRVLYNHLLRNESGASINFWATTTLPLIQKFCKVGIYFLLL